MGRLPVNNSSQKLEASAKFFHFYFFLFPVTYVPCPGLQAVQLQLEIRHVFNKNENFDTHFNQCAIKSIKASPVWLLNDSLNQLTTA